MLKSRTIPPDIGEEDNASETIENESDEVKKVELSGMVPAEIGIALERLQERINALGEIREANNERFARINEEIGELRAMTLESEKGIKEIEVKATLASDMVREVHPEALATEAQKLNAKFESLNAEIGALKSFNSSIYTELKELKRRVDTIRGTDAILRLHEDIKKELMSIQKIKLSTEAHANKVEQIFIDVQRNFSDFQKLETTTENAISLSTGMRKDVDALKLKLSTISNKRDLEPLRMAIRNNNLAQERIYYDVQKNKEMINVLRMIEIRLSDMIEVNRKDILSIKNDNKSMGSDMEDIYGILKTITKRLNSSKQIASAETGISNIPPNAEKCLRIINSSREAYAKNQIINARHLYMKARELYMPLTNKEKTFVYTKLIGLYNELKKIVR